MATRRATTSQISVLAPCLALIAAASAIALVLRLESSAQGDLLLLATVAIAIGVAFRTSTESLYRTFAAIALATAAGVELTLGSYLTSGSATNVLVWTLMVAGLVGALPAYDEVARATLATSAALLLGISVCATRVDFDAFPGIVLAFSAATASLAFGAAIECGRRHFTPFGSIPIAALWATSGAFALGYTLTGNEIWTALTLFALAAVFLATSIDSAVLPKQQISTTIDSLLIACMLVSLVCAPMLAIAALASSDHLGWPLAGVAAAGFGSAMVLGRSLLQRRDQETEVLARRAQESRLDGLTSLLNRRGFDERLDAEIARSARFGHPLSLLLVDVDDFKLVNDRLGHSAGDEVLRSLAAHIDRSIRTIDIAARYGGEEFAVILPETPSEGAQVVAERILGFRQPGLSGAPITVSIGVAELDPGSGSKDELIQISDTALYVAKRAGKNRVELAR